MSHKPVTHSHPIPMPKHSGLLERKGRFYLNVRVPKDLRPLYRKDIFRKSLGTSDRREAISLVRYEAFKLDSEFAAKRREIEDARPSPTLRKINDREAHEMVFRWFVEQEKLSEQWNVETFSKMDEQDGQEALSDFRTDEVVFSGGSRYYRAEDADTDLDAFLKSTGMTCPKDSLAYGKLPTNGKMTIRAQDSSQT